MCAAAQHGGVRAAAVEHCRRFCLLEPGAASPKVTPLHPSLYAIVCQKARLFSYIAIAGPELLIVSSDVGIALLRELGCVNLSSLSNFVLITHEVWFGAFLF